MDRQHFIDALTQLAVEFGAVEAIDQENAWQLFLSKFEPGKSRDAYQKLRHTVKTNTLTLDLLDSMLKTNFFVPEAPSLSFRFSGDILKIAPKRFPEPIFGFFYIYHPDYFGFHIRFQDLARGGLRTVICRTKDDLHKNAPSMLQECYQLALTQQKKNKDIPEGGSKGILLVKPGHDLYGAQKSYIESLLQLVNCDGNGRLRLSDKIVDHYGKPEYLYLGPDENMHDSMIEWIADYSVRVGYKPGIAFISGKPTIGINHKQYGVTSYGMTVCLQHVLQFLGIDPNKKVFTVKMAGGPDGDVAGNQIKFLYALYPRTAKLLALIDISGLIYDPEGIDLSACADLFSKSEPISYYPIDKLHTDGFLLIRDSREYTTRTNGAITKTRLGAEEANALLTRFIHELQADIFIPAGGRPATLNEENVTDFLDTAGKPTSKAIVEGANLYLSRNAREFLEDKGVLVIQDSTANKGGVICSSFEVLSCLTLTSEEFLEHKEELTHEILDRIKEYMEREITLILKEHEATRKRCSFISNQISERINTEASEHLRALSKRNLTPDEEKLVLAYSLPLLATQFREKLLQNVPLCHKKAIVATQLATSHVYWQS